MIQGQHGFPFSWFFSGKNVMSPLRKYHIFSSPQKQWTKLWRMSWVGNWAMDVGLGTSTHETRKWEILSGQGLPVLRWVSSFSLPWKSHSYFLLDFLGQKHQRNNTSSHTCVVSWCCSYPCRNPKATFGIRSWCFLHHEAWASSRHRNRAFVLRWLLLS